MKTTRQDSLFIGKHSEIAMRSETCVEPAQSGIFYAGKILYAFSPGRNYILSSCWAAVPELV